ncbi:hypothetical protein [Metabacillus lacus]|nr:hypothetical protein [Metabacillus lacus]
MKRELEQAVEHANNTNPHSRAGGQPSLSKGKKQKNTNNMNRTGR